MKSRLRLAFEALAFGALMVPWVQAIAAEPAIDFNRDIRPILSDNCFKCHGPDEKERKANLRLDVRAVAVERKAIVPSKSGESKLIARISSSDEAMRMPPAKTGKHLKPEQVALLKRWIDEGASYSQHWAFVPPVRPALPGVKNPGWVRTPVDRFILQQLERSGLLPTPEADRVTLIRRLTLDLTGLPPTPAEVDAFVHDQSPAAYAKLVERLLKSPHYGERMALDWLDAARFADTHGYHIDSGRDMTKWREWVIEAFNSNKPFDQFTIEQLAGDLLPNASVAQRIASGFNRNHMINFEGGAVPEEYHTAYIVDRVNTTATVWLGLTVGCAQCHDHKYDPISQKEFYQLYAFFYNVPENGLDGSKGNAAPMLRAPTTEQQQKLDDLDRQIKALEAKAKLPDAKEAKQELAKIRKERDALDRTIPSAMVMQEMPRPRDTFVLIRGQYDKKGEKVTANVPAFLPPFPKDAPPNRLALARWLVDPNHPLTARVIVNRYWQMFFGTGLVKTSEDFGSQGEWPSHPELLDWLATEFIRTGWDVKAMIRMLVMSATYRQSSSIADAKTNLQSADPDNRLLSRAPRIRLPAEFIRDQALAAAGLLNPEIGGKSVSPYQPPGLWEELMSRADGANWSAQTYTQSHGKDLYKRTMYTFWKRTCPPAQLATFDAPDRETCTVRRARTNTPLQALILMNDPTYVEASRKLAERVLTEAKTDADRLTLVFRLVVARTPNPDETRILVRVLERQHEVFRKDPERARKLLSVGESSRNEKLEVAALAAWTTVASVVLNLDETVTRP